MELQFLDKGMQGLEIQNRPWIQSALVNYA